MSAPDAGHGRGEEEAQGAGEGGGAEVGGVEAHQAQVRAGHLQGGTLHGGALGHGGAAAPGACRGVQGISRYLHYLDIYTILCPLTVVPAQDVAVPGELGPGGTVQVHRRAQRRGRGVRPGAGESVVRSAYRG